MTQKQINLDKILYEIDPNGLRKLHDHYIKSCMHEAIRQALELAAEKAMVSYSACGDIRMCGCGGECERPDAGINKQSIINVLSKVI